MLNLDRVEQDDRAIERAEAIAASHSHGIGEGDGSGGMGRRRGNSVSSNSTTNSNNSCHGVGSGGGGGGRGGASKRKGRYTTRAPVTPGAASTTTLLGSRAASEDDEDDEVACHTRLMRQQGIAKVTNIELFFDLVYVYAISAIAQTMEHHLTWETVLEMLVVTLAVWWAWIFSAWVFNWFNPDSYLVRLLLLAIMLVNLILSSVIPESYTTRSFLFAAMYVLIQVGRSFVTVIALTGHALQRTFFRILTWFCTTAVLWLVGGWIGGVTRNILWTIAIVIEYLSAGAGFYTPGLGKSTTSDWTINGGHMAERCALFIIIALGESIVVTGEAFQEVFHNSAGIWMFIVAFINAASMWWIYFHSAYEEATHHVEHSNDPGKMGRLSYTYIHVLMVIGIIWVAVGDRLSLEDPYQIPANAPDIHPHVYVAILIGGPILFVAGHACFRWTFCCRTPIGHLVAIALLLAATPIGLFCPVWATAFTTTSVFFFLSCYESYYRAYILPKHSSDSNQEEEQEAPSAQSPC
ncbi:hypothetical protein DFQ26_007288 [Actinomortierella ambigua]|nr:hypothetical protein DFQ26_007288 [Actinomortierella ambigua]